MMNWDKILRKENALEDMIFQVFDNVWGEGKKE